MKKQLVLIPVLIWASFAHSADISNSQDLIRATHERYQASWYKTVTFTQKSTTYNPDGTIKVDTWHEAALLPGKLRIDVGLPADGNGVILADGTMTGFRAGKQGQARPLINMLLVLGFDVYCQPPEATLGVIKGEGYNLAKFHEEIWEGQPVYVVGADKGDLNTKQFWIEKNRLLFVRLLEPTQTDPKKFQDIRFLDYQAVPGGSWISPRVEVYTEGKKVFSEEYSDIQPNAKLDAATFDPAQFSSTHWEKP